MDLNTVCFLMFVFLFAGYLILEGFDYGVGILLPLVGRTDPERQAVLATLAPVWEGNEVWLVAAGAVLFAAFPAFYALLFSGLYLALLLLLAALILRGVAFEFRGHDPRPAWRLFWDGAVFAGGLLPALLWGVAVAALLHGLPVDAAGRYAGTPADLLSPGALAGGLAFVPLFALHGAAYLTLKLDRRLVPRARSAGLIAAVCALIAAAGFALLTFLRTDITARPAAGLLLIAVLPALALARRCLARRRFAAAFAASAAAIAFLAGAVFAGLYPRLAVSSLDPAWSPDIHAAAANPLTLKIMAVTLAVALPAVLAFEAWKYRLFRQRTNIAAPGAAARRELWRELRGRLRAQACQAAKLGAVLRKTPPAPPVGAPALHELRTLIARARRLAAAFAALLAILRRKK